MIEYTKIQISAKLYWGFNIEIPNNRLITMTKDEIVDEIKSFMKTFFELYNLEELKNGIDLLNLHIHDDIIIGQTIYVCEHN
jgi:hypothetical protein